MTPKELLRKEYREKRAAISSERRFEAAYLLKEKLQGRGTLLSFSTMGTEVDVKPLNDYLASQQCLYLVSYRMDNLDQIPLSKIDAILVPALVFDAQGFRIGYGKGFYDQFLARVGSIATIGIGFKEQLILEPLPKDPWDIAVKELLLV